MKPGYETEVHKLVIHAHQLVKDDEIECTVPPGHLDDIKLQCHSLTKNTRFVVYSAETDHRTNHVYLGLGIPNMFHTFAQFQSSVLFTILRRVHKLKIDRGKYPHDCTKCGSPAFEGFNLVDCSNSECR